MNQERDSAALSQLLDIIAEMRGYNIKPSKYVSIDFIPPVILTLQLIEMTLSSIGNISSVFQQMGVKVDPYFFLKQYVPHIDWDGFERSVDRKEIEDKTRTDLGGSQGQDQMGMGGGGGYY